MSNDSKLVYERLGVTMEHLHEGCVHGDGGCILKWSGKRAGVLVRGGKKYLFKNLVFEINTGITPKKSKIVVLTCGNKTCINYEHMKMFNRKVYKRRFSEELNRDVSYRVRTFGAYRSARKKTRKLSDEDVFFIRDSDEKAQVLSERFGLTPSYIYRVRLGRVYTDVGKDSSSAMSRMAGLLGGAI